MPIKQNSHSAKAIASFLVLLAVLIFGVAQLATSFSGVAKYNIESWSGDIVEGSGDSVELGGVTFEKEVFPNGLETKAITYGGLLTTASGSRTYTATEVCDNSIITLDGDTYASAQAQKLPTAASIVLRCLPNIGDERKVLVWNLSTDEVPTVNFSATGLDAWIASGSGTTVEIPANRGVWLKFLNFNGSTVSVTTQEVNGN